MRVPYRYSQVFARLLIVGFFGFCTLCERVPRGACVGFRTRR